MNDPAPAGPLTPDQILNDLWAPRATQVLLTGVRLRLFSHIAAGRRAVADIAAATEAAPRGIRHILDALVALGYLDKNGSNYDLTPESARFLVEDSPAYLGEMCRETQLLWQDWARLPEVVETGAPIAHWEKESEGRRHFPELVSAWFPMSFGAAQSAVAALSQKTLDGIRHVLDVAAGSGAWSLAFAAELPRIRVTTVDYPEVTPITRSHAESLGVVEQYDHIVGNIRDVDFGEGYDLAVLGYIVHTEGADWGKKLIEKTYAALRDGGTLVIGDMIPNDERSEPEIPLVFAASDLLLFSREGDVFTAHDYREWLTAAGFRRVEVLEVLGPSPLLVATK